MGSATRPGPMIECGGCGRRVPWNSREHAFLCPCGDLWDLVGLRIKRRGIVLPRTFTGNDDG